MISAERPAREIHQIVEAIVEQLEHFRINLVRGLSW
jgi:hypothetical protein